MKKIIPKSLNSITETFFSEFLTDDNNAILKQLSQYKRAIDIYERTQIALGRKRKFITSNSSTEKVKINIHGIGATNQI